MRKTLGTHLGALGTPWLWSRGRLRPFPLLRKLRLPPPRRRPRRLLGQVRQGREGQPEHGRREGHRRRQGRRRQAREGARRGRPYKTWDDVSKVKGVGTGKKLDSLKKVLKLSEGVAPKEETATKETKGKNEEFFEG